MLGTFAHVAKNDGLLGLYSGVCASAFALSRWQDMCEELRLTDFNYFSSQQLCYDKLHIPRLVSVYTKN